MIRPITKLFSLFITNQICTLKCSLQWDRQIFFWLIDWIISKLPHNNTILFYYSGVKTTDTRINVMFIWHSRLVYFVSGCGELFTFAPFQDRHYRRSWPLNFIDIKHADIHARIFFCVCVQFWWNDWITIKCAGIAETKFNFFLIVFRFQYVWWRSQTDTRNQWERNRKNRSLFPRIRLRFTQLIMTKSK